MSRRNSGDQNIEAHLKNAVIRLRKSKGTAEEAGALWQIPVERAESDAWYLEGTASYTGKRTGTLNRTVLKFMRSEIRRIAVTAAAAVLVIAALSYYQFLVRVDSTIYLDVNPSFTLSVNRLDRIVGAESDNADAEAILAQTDLKGEKADAAVTNLFDAMKEKGYFDGEENTVLVSVECGSRSRLTKMSDDLTEEIREYLGQNAGGGAVFCQDVHIDEETREFARSHSISSGKAALVMKIAREHPEQDKEEMASLSMDELAKYLQSQNIDLHDFTDYQGADRDDREDWEDGESIEPEDREEKEQMEEENRTDDEENGVEEEKERMEEEKDRLEEEKDQIEEEKDRIEEEEDRLEEEKDRIEEEEDRMEEEKDRMEEEEDRMGEDREED